MFESPYEDKKKPDERNVHTVSYNHCHFIDDRYT